MKKSLITFSLIAFVLVGCKNEKKESKKQQSNETTTQQNDSIKRDRNGESVVSGDFIYTKNAAVIKGNRDIYGVVLDSMAQVLAKKVEPVKRNKYDMVPVTVKGKVEANPQKDGWDHVVEITKILMISEPKGDDAIEISSNQQKKLKIKSKKKE